MLLTEVPFAGRRILKLQPVQTKNAFRFLDLPAEIRLMSYGMVLGEHETKIRCYTGSGHPTRPVHSGFRSGARAHLTWDRDATKSTGQDPSPLALLGVNKQFYQETVALAYSTRVFSFVNQGALQVFLDTIGECRQHIRTVDLTFLISGSHGDIHLYFPCQCFEWVVAFSRASESLRAPLNYPSWLCETP
jgi:hypothetical protein